MNSKTILSERLDVVCEGIEIFQKKEGFSYGTDAVMLAAFIRKNGKKAVEFGAGTGIVSLLCEKYKKTDIIYSVEIQEEYYDLLCRNIEHNSSSVIPLKHDIRKIKPEQFGGEVDCVFTNPPYMKADSGFSNDDKGKNSARHEMAGDIYDFCLAASKILKNGGLFYVVYRPDRSADLLDAMRKNRLEPKRMVYVYADKNSRPCLMLVESKKCSKPGLFVTKPFFIYSDKASEEYSDDMKKIYSESEFDEEYRIL